MTLSTSAPEAPPSIGRRLRDWRKAAGLTQSQVAAILEIKQTTISFWELGRNRISAADLGRLATLYQVPDADLGSALRKPN